MENKSLNESVIDIRVKLQNSGIKKSGVNKYAGFDYFELSDFLPKLNELMQEEKINDRFYIKDNYATLELQKGGEFNIYTIPFVLFETPLTYKKDKDGNFIKDKNDEYIQVPSMQDIQYLGALNTYYKRYLYLNAFGITDGEIIDSMDNNNLTSKNNSMEKKQVKIKSLATEDQIKRIKSLYNEEEQKKALEIVKKSKIEDLTVLEASQLISKRGEK